MNPLCRLLDKPREEFTRADLVKVVEKQGIERITFRYPALDGKLKELKIPVADRTQTERILASGERVDGSSLYKGLVEVALSDLYVVPVYRTAFLNPFDPGSLDFVCRFLTRDGERAQFTTDAILHRASQTFSERHRLDLWALGELEFFLISDPGHPLYPAARQSGYHSTTPFAKTGAIVDEMIRHITTITGAVKYAHNEVGLVERVRSNLPEIADKRAEQLEVELLSSPLEDMGDYLLLARWIIRNVAFRHGCVATFAPKIEEGAAGNGLHVHMELRRDGRNVMRDSTGCLTEEALRLIGGLCRYAGSLTAFGNTVSSAYLRLVPHQEAPTRICWSDMNRSALIRVPLGWAGVGDLSKMLNPQQVEAHQEEDGRQTVELRSPDGSALVQLLLAGIALAADWGLSHHEAAKMAESLYVTGNIFENAKLLRKLEDLPTCCAESAKVLVRNRALYERDGVFPASIIDYVARLLEAENDFDMNKRFAELPAEDRLHATRQIMHKDLHRH